jgi:aminoglycoside phosphotransferase (APT) family kinase protein
VNAAPPELPSRGALARVPGLESGAAPLRAERLEGGLVNESWRIDTLRGRFVLRVDGPASQRPGVDRARERTLHDIAARAGIAPPALIWDDAAGIQVREFVDGRVWREQDLEVAAQLRRLGGRLAQLHALEVPDAVAPFDPDGCALQYLRSIEATGASTALASAVRAAVRAAAEIVAARRARAVIVHGDLACANLVDTAPDGEPLMLLDWEYAQVADPVYDVACVLAYSGPARPHAALLLQAVGLAGEDADRALGEAIRVYEGLTWLWLRARATRAC